VITLLIKGLHKTSLIDYPGNICSVVFTSGCNFRCPYCQNPDLVFNSPGIHEITEEEVFEAVDSRQDFIDGVCISGGEPTLHVDLPEFCEKLKKRGFKVKIDTNGSSPEMLKTLIERKLVDFIAMDIKGPIERYDELSDVAIDAKVILESIKLIMESGVDYEFRMTVVPGLISSDDIAMVGEMVRGAKKFSLQQFNNKTTLQKRFQNVEPYPVEKLNEFRDIMKNFVEKCEIRGVA
jgi:pyruvate formate lyase activating enzyme